VNLLGALLVVAGFVVILHAMRLVPKGVEVASASQAALAVIRDPDLDDDAKAALMQRHAKRLFALFLLLAGGGAAALLLPLALVYGLAAAGLMSYDGVIATLVSWQFLLVTTLGAALALSALARLRQRRGVAAR
jgi:hypothetical protein